MKKFKKIIKNQKGLTLIELLAVIVILAIVAAIAVPAIGNVINNSRDKAILADASSIISGAKLAMTDGACKGVKGVGTSAAGDNICDKTELAKYVDGITLAEGDQVAKSETEWTLTWAGLTGFSSTDSKYYLTGAQTERAILAKLDQ
ncbi:prepilin-type N-terminal cleavage/methylation domain-containing protein [Psychrobacillus sp. OK028]|uniref:prepilin-type N-terminal cleavage/methylation domain-containing protein n=1 Tax=Psychrobacillus sp. OK028 TaxID=1884359 RepID=UPI00088A993E|nr:prepilin-type N-terminal cleavage/methylation domain-containing protein [Psychrobacillus sp. OK028]SDM80037.1 prepilin-type N-terminal cleavage/methylation domain-containing protein [Psychrobacillus sp. OK028]